MLSAFRAHRTVVLPSWQGVRIGSNLSDAAALLFTKISLLKFWRTKFPEKSIETLVQEIETTGVKKCLQTFGLDGVYFGQTVHPKFGRYRDRSHRWKPTKYNHTWQRYKIETWKQRKQNIRVKLKVPRFLYSHVYSG